MKLLRKVGVTSEIWQIFVRDSSSTTGAGLTGLTNASSGLTAYYHRDTDTTATAISVVSMTVGTFTSGGFKEIDATNQPGWYQFCPPNAALASGAKSCAIHLKGVTNMAPLPIEVDLDAQVDVTFWNGTVVATPNVAGIPQVDATKWVGGTIPAVNTTGVPLVDAFKWLGGTIPAVNTTGIPKVDLVKINGTDVSSSTDPIDVNLVKVNGTSVGCTLPASGIVSTQGDVRGGIDNVNITYNIPPVFNRPISGTAAVRLTVHIHGYTGAMAAGDSAPTVTVSTADGTSKNALLSQDYAGATPSTTMSSFATGEYELYYQLTSGESLDNLTFLVTTVKNSITKIEPRTVQVVGQPLTFSQITTTQMTESYRAAGAAPTLAQAQFELIAGVLDHSISGTTKTIKKIDGTAAKTYTLDSATTPTSITETT